VQAGRAAWTVLQTGTLVVWGGTLRILGAPETFDAFENIDASDALKRGFDF